MLPPRSRNAMVETTLPADPEPGEIFEMPEGHVAGAAHVLHMVHNDVYIGTSEEFMRVANVSGKATVAKTSSVRALEEGDILTFLFTRYDVTAVKYVEYFGWQAHEFAEESDNENMGTWEVVSFVPVGPQQDGLNTYSQVCLSRVRETEK